jgi:NADH-quinone oxidoreductase subunit L
MTSFYMFRLIFLTFFGSPRMSHEVEHHVHESPKSMTVPLIVLAFCSIFAGWLGWPHSLGGSDRFGKFLEPVFATEAASCRKKNHRSVAAGEKEEEHNTTEWLLMALSLAAAGRDGAWPGKLLRHADKTTPSRSPPPRPPIYNSPLNKYYVDEGYDYVFTGRRKVGDVRLGVLGLGEASRGSTATSSTAASTMQAGSRV